MPAWISKYVGVGLAADFVPAICRRAAHFDVGSGGRSGRRGAATAIL